MTGRIFLPEPIALKEQVWPIGTEPLVTTRTMVYNQVKYVDECIESILKQKTTFPVRIFIHDDASSDGTREVVEKYAKLYPNLIFAYLQKFNTYSDSNKTKLREEFMSLAKIGKYQALCEGDDYWIDDFKLQRQVDFLENNEDYGAVFTDFDLLNEATKKVIPQYNHTTRKDIPTGDVFSNLLYTNPYVTATSMFRSKFYESYNYDFSSHNITPIDYTFWLHIASTSKIGYLQGSSAAYRVLENSASHSVDLAKEISFIRTQFKIAEFFSTIYGKNLNKRELHAQIRRSEIKAIINKRKFLVLFSYLSTPLMLLKYFLSEAILKKVVRNSGNQ